MRSGFMAKTRRTLWSSAPTTMERMVLGWHVCFYKVYKYIFIVIYIYVYIYSLFCTPLMFFFAGWTSFAQVSSR